MTNEELLLQLRDIQAPAEPAWWLIASGYLWLAALLASLVAGVWLLRRQRRNERLARLAQRELQMIHADYQHNLDTRLLAWRV